MPPIIYIIITLIATALIIGLALLIHHLTQEKYNDFVLKNSICLKQLNEINQRYNFYPYLNFDQFHTYDNDKYYNTISCKDYLIYQLQYIRKKVLNQIEKISTNKQQYTKYLNEINSISQFSQFQTSIDNLNLDKLIKIERLIFEKLAYRTPTTQFYLTVTLYCSSISGRIYEKKANIFIPMIFIPSIKG